MPKLNQVLAIEKQTKTNSYAQLTELYQLIQKGQLLNGVARSYKPIDEDGERLPPEGNQVQVRLTHLFKDMKRVLVPLYDATLQRDAANCGAKADVLVDGKKILEGVPAVYLLWLEKQLTDMHTVIVKLPTLPLDESWQYDPNQDCFATSPAETARTKKIPRAFVKAEATEHHPAQVEMVHEDKLVGYWTTTKFSGALPRDRAQELRERIEKLMAAVKFAREQANCVDAPPQSAGDAVFAYLFA